MIVLVTLPTCLDVLLVGATPLAAIAGGLSAVPGGFAASALAIFFVGFFLILHSAVTCHCCLLDVATVRD